MIPDYLTIGEASRLIETRAISPVELVRSRLDRIGAIDPGLHAFVTVTAELAMAQARVAEEEITRGDRRGPLHGIPISLKDIYATSGILTTAHSYMCEHSVPKANATTVDRLFQAGAVLLGKVALAEFATGSVHEGPFPAARNPWNREHVPGISSSGSGAAVAAGLCLGSLGTDTGGSVRGPASYCGIVGIRPTYGRVSRRGIVPLCWSLDTAGPLAPTVRDCALLLGAIAGHDPGDPTSSRQPVPDYLAGLDGGIRGMRIGIDRDYFFGVTCDPAVRVVVEEAVKELGRLGADVRTISLPLLRHARTVQNIIHAAESHAYHAARLRSTPELYGPTVRNYFRLGAFIGTADYLQAQRVRAQIRQEMLSILDDVDVLVTPTMPTPPERFDQSAGDRLTRPNFMQPFSLAGVPAISVPCGFTDDGLPVGLQIAGRPFDEATVFQVAHSYEQATAWHTTHPAL